LARIGHIWTYYVEAKVPTPVDPVFDPPVDVTEPPCCCAAGPGTKVVVVDAVVVVVVVVVVGNKKDPITAPTPKPSGKPNKSNCFPSRSNSTLGFKYPKT
jgi:hypothetical protein